MYFYKLIDTLRSKLCKVNKYSLIESSTLNLSFPKSSLSLVGVGPGDPSLLTIAGINEIKNATLVAYPIAKKGSQSMAAHIAADWIQGKKLMPLIFPMVCEKDTLHNAWQKSADKLIQAFKKGERVVFISQGDTSLYSTSSYLSLYIRSRFPECDFKVIPGINSFSAAAAAAKWPLSLQKESLLVSPVPDNPEEFEAVLEDSLKKRRVLVFLKLGVRWEWAKPILEKKGLLDKTLFVERIGFPDEEIVCARDLPASEKPYFSLLIIRTNWPLIIP